MTETPTPDIQNPDTVADLADKASALEKALRNTIETQPYAAVGIALALGWFFGRLHRPF